ncbi:anthranilate synthase component I family protein [bacterium]|nr:anthranilate synthase component I family protein [bacterium]
MKTYTISGDLLTPVAAFLKLRNLGSAPFLMESVTGGERFGRFSFIGLNPDGAISAEAPGKASATIPSISQTGPLRLLLCEFEQNCTARHEQHLPFNGGLIGVIGFDWIHELEQMDASKQSSTPLAWLGNYEQIIIFDHLRHEVILAEQGNSKSAVTLHEITQALEKPVQAVKRSFKTGHRSSSFEPADFCASVDKLKHHIVAGDIFQAVLSQRFQRPAEGDAFELYRSLRRVNPSPYMFYHETPVGTFIGASPELQVGVSLREVRINPIAGTRPRGANETADKLLEHELVSDPKERAEHMMLVDLARNDLGRACEFGSVAVRDLASVHRFSHVMHLVSDIRGRLRDGKFTTDALAASFPAGTVSGAPKVRALQLILENEPVPREFYSGAAGFLGSDGNAEFCIMLRTAVLRDGVLSYQAGAGIVADSTPENELAETEHKAAAIERALAQLEKS